MEKISLSIKFLKSCLLSAAFCEEIRYYNAKPYFFVKKLFCCEFIPAHVLTAQKL